MWMAKQMAAQTGGGDSAVLGRVTAAQNQLTVQADGEYREVPLYLPPGMTALPRVGDTVLLVEAGGEKRLIGALSDREDLEPGEIRLRSAGGAEIVLKNDGRVLINGASVGGAGTLSAGGDSPEE